MAVKKKKKNAAQGFVFCPVVCVYNFDIDFVVRFCNCMFLIICEEELRSLDDDDDDVA